MSRRGAAEQSIEKVLAQEVALAEQRGAARGRAELGAELRQLVEELQRVVRLGDQRIAVVEVSALKGALETQD